MIYFIRAVLIAFVSYLAFSVITADWWWMLGQEDGDVEARIIYVLIVFIAPFFPWERVDL
ncbi:MAG: hypothetical protein RIA09_15995 [Hoeflea sp.]|jgi:hypothetical protein|uniref:hypothetical protein n=1 Tax=Hoeflea sp. TaxID=1940281 RepID=UPI0032EC6121